MNLVKLLNMLEGELLDDAREMVREEIKVASAKTRGGGALKRLQAARRYVAGIDEARPRLRGAWWVNGNQCLCDGFTAYIFDAAHAIQDAPEIDGDPMIDLEKIWSGQTPGEAVTIRRADLKAAIDIYSARFGRVSKNNPGAAYLIGTSYYNPRYLLQTLDMMGLDEVQMINDVRPTGIGRVQVEGMRAVVLPINVQDENASNIIKAA